MENIETSANVSEAGSGEFNVSQILDSIEPSSQQQVQDSESNGSNNGQPEIDEKFSHLDPVEARFRTIQSRYDQLQVAYSKIVEEYEQANSLAELFEEMTKDPELLATFVSQYKPDLIKPRDTGDLVKEKIREEFGENFRPELTREQAERDDPGGTDWRYYKRLDSLYNELQNGGGVKAKTIQEYKAKQAQLAKAQEMERQKEFESTKKELNMSDAELQETAKFAQSLTFRDLVKIKRFLQKFPTQNPNIVNQSGSKPVQASPRAEFLKQFGRIS